MSEKIQIQTQVSVETQQAKARLDSFLQDSSKWNSKMAQQLSLDVQFLFPSQSEVAKQFEKYRKTAQSQFKKVNWEFMYYSKNGKESGSQVFNYTNTKLDYATAASELKRLKELRERILSGKAVSYGDWAEKDTKALEKLIQNLEKTTLAFEQLQRTRSKNITRETTAAANREIDEARREERRREEIRKQGTQANKEAGLWVSRRQADAESNRIINGGSSNATLASMRQYYKSLEQASKNVLDIEKRIARERARNVRGGGNLESSILRQIDLYRRLAEAAKKAGNAQTAALAGKKVRALEEQARGLGILNNLFGRQGRIMTGLQSIAARYFSIYTVANFARKVAETTGYFQQQQVALEGILGSAAKARDTLAEIKNFALQSPFQTKELVTFTKQLAAFGVGNNDLFPTVKKLADISAGLGVDMSRIILAYGQVKSAAVLRGQELRQFTEAGIPMVQKLADKFTELNGKLVTTGEVFKLISERQVPFEMVAQVLSDMTAEGGQFYKMQENITETTYGQIQKLRDLWTIAMDEMGKTSESPINKTIKGLQNIVKNIQPIMAMVTSTVIGSALGRGLTALYRMIRALKIMRVAAAGTRGVMATLFGGIGLVVGAIAGWVYNARKKSQELTRAMNDVANAYDKDTRKMTQGIDSLVDKFSSATAGTKKFSDAASTLVSNYGKYLSSDITDAITKQGDAAQEAANKFIKMADSIKSAIIAEQEWNKEQEKGDTAAGKASEKGSESAGKREGMFFGFGEKDILSEIIYTGGQQSYANILPGIRKYEEEKEIDHEVFLKNVASIYGQILQETSALGKNFDESVQVIKDEFVNRVLALRKGIDKETIKKVADNAIKETSEDAKDAFNEAAKNYKLADSTFFAELLRPFKNFDEELKGSIGKGKDFLEDESIKYQRAFDYLKESFMPTDEQGNRKENFIGYEGSDLQKIIELPEGQKHVTEAAYDVVEAIEKFKKTFEGQEDEAITNGYLDIVSKRFQQYVELRKGQSAEITNAFNNPKSKVYKWRDDKDLKNIVATYGNPTSANLFEKREQLSAAYSAQEEKIRKLKDIPNLSKYWKETLAVWEKERDAMKVLMGGDLYATEEKKKRGGAGAGGGWRRMFSDLFSYIKEARAEEKKLVDHSAGLTEELANQIGSQQLQGTAVDAFWESFQKNKSPFQKIIDKFSEYGIESDVFNEKFLKEALSDIRTKQIDDTGTVNFMDTWIKLTDIIKQRADELDKDTNTKSTADSLRSFLQQMTVEFEKYFGRDQVEKMINEQLKELKKLNSQFAEIRKKNELFESASDASNYLKANRFIYGTDRYQRFDAVETSREQTSKTLNLAIGKGLSNTDAGKELRQILNMSNLNIKNLEALENIRQRLVAEAAKTTLDGMPGDDEATRQANFDQFKGIMSEMDTQIKQLSNDILNEFKTVMQTASPNETRSNTFVNAVRGYQDALGLIAKAEQGKVINEKEANDKRLKALHNFFEKISGEIPQWIKTIYGQDNGTTGISKTGFNVMQMFDGDLETKLKRSISKIFAEQIKAIEEEYAKRAQAIENKYANNDRRKQDYSKMYKMGGISKDEYESIIQQIDAPKNAELQNIAGDKTAAIQNVAGAASGAMGAASGVVAMIDMIVKAIYGAIKSIVEITQTINELDEKLNHGLNMTKQKNGTYVDENGNATIDERYYQQENRWAKTKEVTDAIQTYNQHAMDGWEKLKGGDAFGAGMEIFKSITDLIGDIATIQDADKQREQDKLIRSNEKLERAMEKLADVMKDAAGREKFDVNTDQLANLEEQKTNYQQLLELENEKKKGDDEKAQEYADKYQQAQYQINDIIRSINQDILGTADELASSLTDALTDAFMNGKNAAREWRDTVRGYVGQVLRDLLISDVMAPRIKAILEKYGIKKGETKSDQIIAKFSDANTMVNFRNELFAENAKTLDDINNLAPAIKEMMFWNNNTSELSGGIQGITEDTARTLEGLSNSMLAQLVLLNRSSSTMEGYAEMQVSQFRSLLSIQGAILDTVREFRSDFDSIRNGIRPLHVSIPRT